MTDNTQTKAIGAGGVSGPLMGQPQAMPDLSALTERGAKAWAGVDAQELREGRWYMVNKDGMATLCADETDAEQGAKEAQTLWPHMGPHRAVQLVEAGHESAAANAGGEPVAWQYRSLPDVGGLWFDCTKERADLRAAHPERWEVRALYTHPSPPGGMLGGGWISVDERLPQPFKEVVVYPRPDDYCCEAFCDMAGNWKWAEYEHNFGVHHWECRVEYWLMLPEVPAPPTTSAGSGKGE